MSTLKTQQIKKKLLQTFESILDLSDIGRKDTEREVKILSRCIAAYAVFLRSNCSFDDAAKSVWDMGGDNGIDAAYYDQSERKVILIQSKWITSGTGEPESKDIATFIDGIKDIIDEEIDGFSSRLHEKFNSIIKIINEPGVKLEMTRPPTDGRDDQVGLTHDREA
jgi:hypothetical protein